MLRGFQIRVQPSGNAVYWAEARFGGGLGGNKKCQVGRVDEVDLTEARERARGALDKIRNGIDPLAEKRAQAHEGKTLRQLIADYYACRDLKPRTRKHYEYLATNYFKGWMDKRVADITLHEVRDWYLRIKGKPGDANGASRLLSSLMIYAISQEIITRNPCLVLSAGRMRHSLRARERHIESDDLGNFFKAMVDFNYVKDSEVVARDVILLIITTGLRSAEARTLKWEDVDFKRGKIIIPDTKNGLNHTVPMTPLTWSMLKYRKEHSEGSVYVFRIKGSSNTKSGCVTSFQKTLANICKRAGITAVSAHDLRRTFSTVLNLLGVGFLDHKKLMNHKSKDITSHYAQPDIKNLRGHLERVVDYYDKTFPSMAADSGFTMYNSGALQYKLYGQGEFIPVELSQMEAEDQARQIEEEPEYPWGN